MKTLVKNILKETVDVLLKITPTIAYSSTMGASIQYLVDNGFKFNEVNQLIPVISTSALSALVTAPYLVKGALDFYQESRQSKPITEGECGVFSDLFAFRDMIERSKNERR